MDLRPYQTEIINQVSDRDIVCIPTGTGKGAIIANLAKQFQAQGLGVTVIVPTIDLKAQTEKTLKLWNCPADRVRVSVWLSADSLASEVWLHDECHHSASTTWERLLNKPGVHIGFSATPARLDGKPLNGFKRVLEPYSIQYFMQAGYLCNNLKEFTVDIGYDLSDVSDDCDAQYTRLNHRVVYGRVLEEFRKHYTSNTKAIVYGVTIKHAYHIAEQFQVEGYINVWVIHSGLTKAERAKILQDFRAAVSAILVNVTLLTEGVDVPDANLLVLLRRTSSTPLFRQMFGRILRPKPEATILDFVGNLTLHGSVRSCVGWSEEFEQAKTRQWEDQTKILVCSKCGTVKAFGQPCSACGSEVEAIAKPSQLPRELPGYNLSEYVLSPYQQLLTRLSKSQCDRSLMTRKLIKARDMMTDFNDAMLLQQFLENRYSQKLADKIYRAVLGE